MLRIPQSSTFGTHCAETRARDLMLLGAQLREQGRGPKEAVLFSESWYVNAQQESAAMQMPPSEHPGRQEAIVVVGRSADNRRFTMVIQPFTWDKANHPIWLPIPLAQYDEEHTGTSRAYGILDCLFDAVAVNA